MANQVFAGHDGNAEVIWVQIPGDGSPKQVYAAEPARRYWSVLNVDPTSTFYLGGDGNVLDAAGDGGGFPVLPLQFETFQTQSAIWVVGPASQWICFLIAH